MQSLFWVCLLSECTFNLKYQSARDLSPRKTKSILIQLIVICWKLVSHKPKMDLLGQTTGIPVLPRPAHILHHQPQNISSTDLKINKQKWHSSLLHLKQLHLVTEVALQNTSNGPSQVIVADRPTWLKFYLLLHFSLIRSQMGVVCLKGETRRARKVRQSQESQCGATLSDGLLP